MHWPGVSWVEIERDWTDSQFWMLVGRLEDRIEDAPRGYAGARPARKFKAPDAPARMGVGVQRYPRLKSDRINRQR